MSASARPLARFLHLTLHAAIGAACLCFMTGCLAIGPLAGLFIETPILAPFALGYLLWSHTRPGADAINAPGTLAILSLAGVATALPLLWFIAASKRLPLSTIGFLQYMNPTLQFVTAVALFGEPLGRERLVAFAMIWAAVGLFVFDAFAAKRAGGTGATRTHADTEPARV